jgi:hypothetical protein
MAEILKNLASTFSTEHVICIIIIISEDKVWMRHIYNLIFSLLQNTEKGWKFSLEYIKIIMPKLEFCKG